jgi:hypothetical protein
VADTLLFGIAFGRGQGRRYAQKLWIGISRRTRCTFPVSSQERAGAPTPAGRIHRYARTTSG